MEYEKLSLQTWPRREAYGMFSRMSNPFYSVTFTQDVTELYAFLKSEGLSFYYGMIWACVRAVNEVDAFRLALRDGELVRYPGRDPSFTDLKPGAELFHIVTMERMDDIRAFCRAAGRKSAEQTGFIDEGSETDSLIYFSCFPWVELTSLTNARDLTSESGRSDSIPRIAWGRFRDTPEGRRVLGLSLEVNHRFIDGVHIGLFAERLSLHIKDPLA